MKRSLALILIFALLCALLPPAAAAPAPNGVIGVEVFNQALGRYEKAQAAVINTVFDGSPLDLSQDVPALALGGRTMVPVRTVGEPLGAAVTWIQNTDQVVLSRDEHTVVLTLGASVAVSDGEEVPLPDGVPAVLVRCQGVERTMVPIRFVSEQLGAAVDWIQDSYTAAITSHPNAVTHIEADSDRQTVLIATAQEPNYLISDFGDRLVVDILDAQLTDQTDGAISVDNDFITAVRYAEHGFGLHPDHAHSVRVVLDLKEGITCKDNITVESSSDGVVITTFLPHSDPETPDQPQSPQEPPAQKPESPEPSPLPSPSLPSDPVQKTVVIDAGHGGDRAGAVYEGIQEKDVNLAVALKVEALLREMGINVLMTRTEDAYIGLYERAEFANSADADLFVSIHSNAYTNPDVYGALTYYHPSSSHDRGLAKIMQAALCASTGALDRGVAADNFVVLRETNMCALLVEMGFMTNHDELMRLCDPAYQDKLAQGIANGILLCLQEE